MFPATADDDDNDDAGCWDMLLLFGFCSTSRSASAAENRSFSDLVRLCDMVVGSIVRSFFSLTLRFLRTKLLSNERW